MSLGWLRTQPDAEIEVPGLLSPQGKIPRGYQRVGAAGIICTPRMLLADEPGLGKTLTTLMALRWLREAGHVSRVLLVCPGKIMHQWVGEAEKWFGDAFSPIVLEGTPAQRRRMYDALAKHDGHPAHHRDLVITTYATARIDQDRLAELRFDQLVCDEASLIKNHEAAQTKAVVRLAANIPRRLAISATPWQNHLDEYHTVLSAISPETLGSRVSFLRRHCNTMTFPVTLKNGYVVHVTNVLPGGKHLDVFKESIQPVVLQRTIEEVGGQMPELTVVDRMVELTPVQRARYDEVCDGILSIGGEDKEIEAIQRVTRLSQICLDTALVYPGEVASAKCTELESLLTGELDGKQVVIFSKSLEFLKQSVMPLLRRLDKSFCEIHGGIDNATVEQNRQAFVRGDVQVAVMTTAGEMGLNLESAQYMICCDVLYNEARMKQVYARIRRLSSEHSSVVVMRLLASDTLEERIVQMLDQDRALLDFMDSPAPYSPDALAALLKLVNRQISLLN